MRPHRADGIEEGGPVLDAQAVDSVRVVTAPDLRGIIEHGGIKASAASAAALQKDVGEAGKEALQQFVDAEYVAVIELSRAFRS